MFTCLSYQIFIENNQGDEEVTVVNKITLIGWPLSNMDVKNLKKVEDH